MSEHTSGPWSASDKFGGTVWAGEDCVAEVSGHDGTWATSEANAHLIAAAPEMLIALKDLRDWIRYEVEIDGCVVPAYTARLRAAEAAIAKAEGKP